MPTLSKQLIAFAVISLGLTWWSFSTVEVIKFSTETLVKSAERLIDRSAMAQKDSDQLNRTFQMIVSNDRAWQRISRAQPIAILGFAVLAVLFGYAAWAVGRLERKLLAVTPADR